MITYKIKDEDNKLLSVKENQFESFLVDNNITEYKIQGFNSAALSYDVTVNKVIERKPSR